MTNYINTLDAVWRTEQARLITGLVRIVRDVGLTKSQASRLG